MSVKYYPNRIFRASLSPVDAITQKDTVNQFKFAQDITATAIDEVISPLRNWKIVGIKFTFSNANARDYSASVIGGRSVIENLNDFLFFKSERTLPQKITLDQGFYTGTQLASELESKLDANSAFSDLGVTFTVVYDDTAGEYTITPSSGNIQYLEENTFGALPDRYSISGHLFGFNQDTSTAASITSDTAVPGLNSETAVLLETTNTDLSHYNSDPHTLSMDEAIKITTNTAAVEVNYSIDYQNILS
jgi:hypothetical protein